MSSPDRQANSRRRLPSVAGGVLLVVMAGTLGGLGLGWGLPSDAHVHSFHPDEQAVVAAARSLDWSDLQLDPGFYNHGTLSITAVSLVDRVSEALGLAPPRDELVESWAATHRAARGVSWLATMLTVLLTVLLGKRAGTAVTGWLAGAVVALTPLLIDSAHYGVPDASITCVALGALLLIDRLAAVRRGRWRGAMLWAGLAGVAVGAAAATKLAGILLLPTLVVGALLAGRTLARRGALAATALSAAGVAFVVGSPPLWLATDAFLDTLHYELIVHPRTGHELLFVDTGPGWRYLLLRNLPIALGPALAILAIVGAIFLTTMQVISLRRSKSVEWHSHTDLLLLTWIATGFAAMSISEVRFIRYLTPFAPALAIVSARALLSPWPKLPRWGRALLSLVIAGVLVWTGIRGGARARLFLGPDPRDEAAAWIQEHVPAGSTIGLMRLPWYYSPPLSPFNGRSHTREAFESWCASAPWKVTLLELDVRRLEAEAPEWIVVSSFEIAEEVRLGKPGARHFLMRLQRDYRLAAPPFQLEERLGPFGVDPTGDGYPFPPHGWRYVNPTIWVYRRKG